MLVLVVCAGWFALAAHDAGDCSRWGRWHDRCAPPAPRVTPPPGGAQGLFAIGGVRSATVHWTVADRRAVRWRLDRRRGDDWRFDRRLAAGARSLRLSELDGRRRYRLRAVAGDDQVSPAVEFTVAPDADPAPVVLGVDGCVDGGDGRARPWCSFAYAWRWAPEGGTIEVRGEHQVGARLRWNREHPLTIGGDGVLVARGSDGVALAVAGARDLLVEGISVRGSLDFTDARDLRVRSVRVQDGRIRVRGGASVAVGAEVRGRYQLEADERLDGGSGAAVDVRGVDGLRVQATVERARTALRLANVRDVVVDSTTATDVETGVWLVDGQGAPSTDVTIRRTATPGAPWRLHPAPGQVLDGLVLDGDLLGGPLDASPAGAPALSLLDTTDARLTQLTIDGRLWLRTRGTAGEACHPGLVLVNSVWRSWRADACSLSWGAHGGNLAVEAGDYPASSSDQVDVDPGWADDEGDPVERYRPTSDSPLLDAAIETDALSRDLLGVRRDHAVGALEPAP